MPKLMWIPMVVAVVGCFAAPDSAAQPKDGPLAIKANDAALQWGACPPIFPAGCQITVLHGAPDKPNADVFLRVPGGYDIPAHRHTSAERMILVSGTMRVEYSGSAATTLAAGDYAFGPAGLPHRASCLGAEACTLFIAFEGPVDATVAELSSG
ncbi:MAG: cupin domain-containing protein [Sphingomicrobium sp.]